MAHQTITESIAPTRPARRSRPASRQLRISSRSAVRDHVGKLAIHAAALLAAGLSEGEVRADLIEFGLAETTVDAALPMGKVIRDKRLDDVLHRKGGLKADRDIELVCAADLEPEPMEWLWAGRIPLDTLFILGGEEGMGKSTAMLKLAAMVTRGKLEGELEGQPSNVLLVAHEDIRVKAAIPRLIAADADLTRVHFADMKDETHAGGVALPEDAAKLGKLAESKDVRLVIVDPIDEHTTAATDTYNAPSVRQALAPLRDAAESYHFTGALVAHLNKGSSTSERVRLMGSAGYRSAVRATMIFGLDPDDRDGARGPNRVLVPGKNNYARPARAHRVRIDPVTITNKAGRQIGTTHAAIGEECDFTDRDVLGAEEAWEREKRRAEKAQPKAMAAEELLRRELKDGPKPATAVLQAAEDAGIGETTLRAVKRTMGVVAKPNGFQGASVWELSAGCGHPV